MNWNKTLPLASLALASAVGTAEAQWSVAFGGDDGLNAEGIAIIDWNGELAVAGRFTEAGGTTANSISVYDGFGWDDADGGLTGGPFGTSVVALEVYNGDLVAGGDFTMAGGSAIAGIASFDGLGWSGFGSGLPGGFGSTEIVLALEVDGSDLVAGGQFTEIGGTTVNNLARWNGSTWSALGAGTSGDVSAILSHSTGLYVGGAFSMAGGQTANGFARWNGSSWEVFGGALGANANVKALAVYNFGAGERIIVGGNFSRSGGAPGDRCVVFDPSTDSFVPQGQPGAVGGFDLDVNALFTSSFVARGAETLVAGGSFATAEGWVVDGLAFWANDHWQPLGGGTDGDVSGLADIDGDLVVTGTFGSAGGTSSANIGEWLGDFVPVSLAGFEADRLGRDVVVRWIVDSASDHAGFHVHRDFGGATKTRLTDSLLRGRAAYSFTDEHPPIGELRYWLEEVSEFGHSSWHGPVAPGAMAIPTVAHLAPLRPNPARGDVAITVTFDVATDARIAVFDAAGREVATVFEGIANGTRTFGWDSSTAPSGVYFVRLVSGYGVESRKVSVAG